MKTLGILCLVVCVAIGLVLFEILWQCMKRPK